MHADHSGLGHGFRSYPNIVHLLCAPHLNLLKRMVVAALLASLRLGNSLLCSIAWWAWRDKRGRLPAHPLPLTCVVDTHH